MEFFMKRKEKVKKALSEMQEIYVEAGKNATDFKKNKKKLLQTTVKPFDPSKVTTLVDVVDSFKGMSIQARRIGECADVYENMLSDKKRPTVFLGIAGPLIAGGLRKVFRDMIEYGMVDAVVSTGAILFQDLFQALGHKHYKGSPDADDAYLREHLVNRIYDTYVDDEKFIELDTWIGKFADSLETRPYSTREFLHCLGKTLKDPYSILGTAARHNIPVFAPALNDSSIGIGLTDYYHIKRMLGESKKMSIDPIRDNYELTQIVVKSKATSAIYVAGGVPKNYINDSVVMAYIFGKITGGHTYAFQVTTDVPHWGGLSGSTLDEAKSWGKVNTKARRAMAFVEPTVSLPLIVGSTIQKGLWKGRKRASYEWENDILKSLKYDQPIEKLIL
jgi:deoxyhypusine synthase